MYVNYYSHIHEFHTHAYMIPEVVPKHPPIEYLIFIYIHLHIHINCIHGHTSIECICTF